jgi:hypothetical protein
MSIHHGQSTAKIIGSMERKAIAYMHHTDQARTRIFFQSFTNFIGPSKQSVAIRNIPVDGHVAIRYIGIMETQTGDTEMYGFFENTISGRKVRAFDGATVASLADAEAFFAARNYDDVTFEADAEFDAADVATVSGCYLAVYAVERV